MFAPLNRVWKMAEKKTKTDIQGAFLLECRNARANIYHLQLLTQVSKDENKRRINNSF